MNQNDDKAIFDLMLEWGTTRSTDTFRRSVVDYIATIRQEERRAAFKESVAIIAGQPTRHYIYSGATPMAAETFRDNAIGAIEAVSAIEQAKQDKLEAAANETGEDDK